MTSEIIINTNPRETRVALLENNTIVELYIEYKKYEGILGNIYKGKVIKVLPGMQVAFVDIGLGKAGFLYVSDIDVFDIMDEYEREMRGNNNVLEENETDFRKAGISRRDVKPYPIEEILQKGQEIIVQVSRNPIGTKGARITSYIALPGHLLVFMPTVDQVGVSRRIESEAERKRLKKVVQEIKSPGCGYIVRTVSEGKDKDELLADVNFLTRLWQNIKQKSEKAPAPSLIYRDIDLISRTIRDLYSRDVERVIIDSQEEYERCLELVNSYSPDIKPRITLYEGKEPIFDAYGLEMEIGRALGRKIWLKSGGYIIIEQTEALVAVDVNTGKYVGKRDPEETTLKTNLEAVKEIVYQLRLRNIGGIIIIDFIDMEKTESKEKVFNSLEQALKADRSRTNILKISELGLVEMTRKRVRENLCRILCSPCPYCEGRGRIKSPTTLCYEIFREIRRVVDISSSKNKILVNVHPVVADLLFDEESYYLETIEKELNKKIIIKADYDLHQEQYEINLL